MLAADEHYAFAEGQTQDVEATSCEECGRSVVARFGGVPSALCASCRDDERRMFQEADRSIEGG